MTRFICLTLLILSSFLLAPLQISAEASEKPNVLFIMVDDLNDWIGCLKGHPQAYTPNIDKLASRGTLFTNAHCQGPICGPSRNSLLSGLHVHTTGVYQQPGKGLDKDTKFFHGKLLPQYFAKEGYETLAVGKIAHGYSDKLAFQNYGGKFANFGPKPKKEKRFNYQLPDVPYTGTQTDWGAFPDVDNKMPDHLSADWAVDQLEQKHEKPFLLAVGFIRPHVPFYVPEKWFERFPLDEIQLPEIQSNDFDDIPEIGRLIHELPKYPDLKYLQANENDQFKKCVQAYLACIYFVDAQVGRVLDALEKSKHADNTIIVLMSDHGYHLGEKDRVSKHSLWEESTRVPLIIAKSKSQQKTKAQLEICAKPVGLIDLYPTFLELCDLPVNNTNEGKSLVPLLHSADAPWRFSTITTYAKDNHSLRSEQHRYIRYDDGSEELYDLLADPNCWVNLASEPSSVALRKKFQNLLPTKTAPYHPAVRTAPINAWFEEHFKKQ